MVNAVVFVLGVLQLWWVVENPTSVWGLIVVSVPGDGFQLILCTSCIATIVVSVAEVLQASFW